jgi:hypothetical protein
MYHGASGSEPLAPFGLELVAKNALSDVSGVWADWLGEDEGVASPEVAVTAGVAAGELDGAGEAPVSCTTAWSTTAGESTVDEATELGGATVTPGVAVLALMLGLDAFEGLAPLEAEA